MSTTKPTEKPDAQHAAVDERPHWGATMPGFPAIDVYWQDSYVSAGGKPYASLEYCGWPKDLRAAGVLKPEMVRASGKHHKDAEGDGISVTRYWRRKNGRPQRYFNVKRRKAVDLLLLLPGAQEAREALLRYRALEKARDEGPPPPGLRLVVDNTRGAP
jgi:hypothetical protein